MATEEFGQVVRPVDEGERVECERFACPRYAAVWVGSRPLCLPHLGGWRKHEQAKEEHRD